jgi:hypothetical protein
MARVNTYLNFQGQAEEAFAFYAGIRGSPGVKFPWATRPQFRLLSTRPGPDVDRDVTAALTCTTAEEADQMLDALARAHLVRRSAQSGYRMHGLLRDYARELTGSGRRQ